MLDRECGCEFVDVGHGVAHAPLLNITVGQPNQRAPGRKSDPWETASATSRRGVHV